MSLNLRGFYIGFFVRGREIIASSNILTQVGSGSTSPRKFLKLMTSETASGDFWHLIYEQKWWSIILIVDNFQGAPLVPHPLNNTIIIHTCAGGVFFSLKDVIYANNSVIPITEIGETNTTSNTGLQCITDRKPCCAAVEGRAGQWLFPNGTNVPVLGTGAGMATAFYRNRGNDGTVNLNRISTSIVMPYGKFCCTVPDNDDSTPRLCIDICKNLTLHS